MHSVRCWARARPPDAPTRTACWSHRQSRLADGWASDWRQTRRFSTGSSVQGREQPGQGRAALCLEGAYRVTVLSEHHIDIVETVEQCVAPVIGQREVCRRLGACGDLTCLK